MKLQHSALATLVVYIVSMYTSVFSVSALAAQDVLNDTTAINGSAVPTAAVNCDDACSMVNNGWSTTDDQWCANHGVTTNGAVVPQTQTTTTTATVSIPACNVTIYAEDVQSGMNCQSVNTNMDRCKFHNSQLGPQCLAYQAANNANSIQMQRTLLFLDEATTIACGTVCIAGVATAGMAASWQYACQAPAIAAGAAEFADSLKMKNGPIGMAIGMVGAATAGMNGVAAVGVMEAPDVIAPSGGGAPAPNPVAPPESARTTTSQKAIACSTAALFAVMTALRYKDFIAANNAKNKACSAIQSLISAASAVNPDGSATAAYNATTGAGAPGYSAYGSATGGNSGAINGSTSTTPATQAAAVSSNCAAQGLVCMDTGGATDAGFLTNSGLDKAAAPLANQLGAQQNPNAFSSGGGMLNAATAGLGDVGKSLANLAQIAGQNSGDLAGINMGYNPASSMYAGGGGGAHGGSGAGGGADLAGALSGLFGNPDGTPAANRAPSNLAFGAPMSNDIWHTGTKQTLFEIVSTRITKRLQTAF